MSNRILLFIISWILWGIGYYLYQPFLSIFLSKFISPNKLGLFYLLTQIISLPFPFIGRALARKLNVIKTIFIGTVFSGIGLLFLPFSLNFEESLLSISVSQSFYMALPSYYALMKKEGENEITRVWAFSISPAIILPSIGGLIVSYYGYPLLFILAGILITSSALPLVRYRSVSNESNSLFGKNGVKNLPYIIIFIIIPVALSSQFIFLVIDELYKFSPTIIGLIATLAELFGMSITYLLSRLNFRTALYIAMSVFSMQVFCLFYPYFAIFFGSWEAIIPLSLGTQKTIDDFALAVTMQILGWISGFLIASIIANPEFSIIISSIISLLLIFLIKLKS